MGGHQQPSLFLLIYPPLGFLVYFIPPYTCWVTYLQGPLAGVLASSLWQPLGSLVQAPWGRPSALQYAFLACGFRVCPTFIPEICPKSQDVFFYLMPLKKLCDLWCLFGKWIHMTQLITPFSCPAKILKLLNFLFKNVATYRILVLSWGNSWFFLTVWKRYMLSKPSVNIFYISNWLIMFPWLLYPDIRVAPLCGKHKGSLVEGSLFCPREDVELYYQGGDPEFWVTGRPKIPKCANLRWCCDGDL